MDISYTVILPVEAVMAHLGPAHEAAVLEEEVREESVPKLSRHTPQAGSLSSQDELGFRGTYYMVSERRLAAQRGGAGRRLV